MAPPSNLLQAGMEALQQQRFPDAVQFLTTCCDQSVPGSKDYYQAQMYLVRAYQDNGQAEAAIALCQQMLSAEVPQVRTWAERTLPRLTPVTPVPVTPAPVTPTPAPEPAPEPEPAPVPRLTQEESEQLLKQGNAKLKMQQFAAAVEALEAYCQGTDPATPNYAQAQMWLVKAYKGNEQPEAAIALCESLLNHEKDYVQTWARQYINLLAPQRPPEPAAETPPEPETPASPAGSRRAGSFTGKAPTQGNPPAQGAPPKAGRSPKRGVSLSMRGIAANLAMASGITLSLLFGMVLALSLALIFISGNENPTLGLAIALIITIVFNALIFFIAPLIMDLIQGWLYSTRWTAITEIDRLSPETGRVIREICRQKNLREPRLGIIEDDNPTAFTYGSLPNSARLVVSRGLFKYLDDDEIATVYAHELGHIVHWDFAVMTLAATLVQIMYLIYAYIEEMASRLGDSDAVKQVKNGAMMTAIAAYIFYVIGEYMLLYLSRTREYYADHFAAEVTGNPNGLSRALVKIAYGILEEGQRSQQPSKVLQGTRALGISDAKSAAFTGTAYRVASDPQKVGRVFMWDIFNPWAWWMELNSTHPLTGKRVRALTTYAEQLGLGVEFDMAQVIRDGRSLNKQRLYGTFATDVMMLWADWLGAAIGVAVGLAVLVLRPSLSTGLFLLSAVLIGFGLGTLLKMVFMYPDFQRAPAMDVLSLMSDPYASPLRGKPVKLEGEVIGRGDSGYRFSCDWKLQDPTGLIYVRYNSRFGPLGNFLFGTGQADSFTHQQVRVTGWFRRGIMPWVDLVQMDCDRKWTVHSYHRFWLLVVGIGSIALGFILPIWLRGAIG